MSWLLLIDSTSVLGLISSLVLVSVVTVGSYWAFACCSKRDLGGFSMYGCKYWSRGCRILKIMYIVGLLVLLESK